MSQRSIDVTQNLNLAKYCIQVEFGNDYYVDLYRCHNVLYNVTEKSEISQNVTDRLQYWFVSLSKHARYVKGQH